MGLCNEMMSSCALGGYAMESRFVFQTRQNRNFSFNLFFRCHLGKVALYDTVKRKGWSVNIRTHGIKYILDYVLNEDWDPASGREVPVIEEERDCLVSIIVHPF
jgi:putative lipase involved disintegration of autophagic bodies